MCMFECVVLFLFNNPKIVPILFFFKRVEANAATRLVMGNNSNKIKSGLSSFFMAQ